jgi:hypothetical protein
MAVRMRLAAGVIAVGFLFGTVSVESMAAGKLSIKSARKAAYKLTRKVGAREGAVYALAGYCKRKSARKVRCWGAIVFADGSAAAQRILVTRKRGKVKARRYSKIYEGTLTDDGGSGASGGTSDEWAVCTSGGFCVGS